MEKDCWPLHEHTCRHIHAPIQACMHTSMFNTHTHKKKEKEEETRTSQISKSLKLNMLSDLVALKQAGGTQLEILQRGG